MTLRASGWSVAALSAGLLALVSTPAPAAAQGLRGWISTTAQVVELRPVTQDTVSVVRVERLPNGSSVFEGRPVNCQGGLICTFFRPLSETSTVAATADLGLTAWGVGMQGLSATALVRTRVRDGGDLAWPRSGDELDVILAYLQYDRSPFRFRLGRQETFSGLGFRGYDGVSVLWGATPWLAVEAFGGRSLARGLSEPANDALAGLEDFVPDRDAYLFGAFVRGEFPRGSSVGLRYQREIFSDRSGLASERASIDLRTDVVSPVRLSGSLDYDVGFGRVGKGHLTLQYAWPGTGIFLEGSVRRYLPYFDLSTIWGFFSPVAYHEGGGQVSWQALEGTSVSAGLAWRTYEDAEAPVIFRPLEDDAWRTEIGIRSALRENLQIDFTYEVERGVGASLKSAEGAVRWWASDRLAVEATGAAFQQFQEFRVGEGRVWGGGLSVRWQALPEMALDGGAAIFRHDADDRSVSDPWNQTRIWSALRFEFGSDADASRPRLRR